MKRFLVCLIKHYWCYHSISTVLSNIIPFTWSPITSPFALEDASLTYTHSTMEYTYMQSRLFFVSSLRQHKHALATMRCWGQYAASVNAPQISTPSVSNPPRIFFSLCLLVSWLFTHFCQSKVASDFFNLETFLSFALSFCHDLFVPGSNDRRISEL